MAASNPYVEPRGYRRNPGSGLILPEASSRERQTWTNAELKVLNRAGKLLQSRGVQMLMLCTSHPECKEKPLLKIPQPDGFILRCAHMDRVFQTTF